jgi:hypothetical protein
MSKEYSINPSTTRKVKVRGENPYEKYVKFIAKNKGQFWCYRHSDIENTAPGPVFDNFNGIFVNNNSGRWEKLNIGCGGIIHYYLSPKVRVETPEQNKERRQKEGAALRKLIER